MAITLLAILKAEPSSKGGSREMRRRKATTMQVNIRLDVTVVDQLEARARANRVSFSEEARQRLIDSLDPKPEPSLDEFRSAWLRRLRDTIEHDARKEGGNNIEAYWRTLQRLDAKFALFYGDVETELDSHAGLRNPRVRALLRGAPTLLLLPDETKARGQS
jgi:hypothetical protein